MSDFGIFPFIETQTSIMKTLILGASTNPERYAYKATWSLVKQGHEVVLLGIKVGEVAGIEILTGKPSLANIDTVTVYVGAKNQVDWVDYILDLKPRRVIFNPGAENPEFAQILENKGIEVVEGCTLVMLSVGIY